MHWGMQYTVGMQYAVGTQYTVGMQYAVGTSAKRSTHTVNAVENILHLILTGKYKHNLTQIASKYNSKEHCFNGHPKLYHVNKECMYQINKKGILQTCRNGKHLQDCSKFNCQKYFKFKCPRTTVFQWAMCVMVK